MISEVRPMRPFSLLLAQDCESENLRAGDCLICFGTFNLPASLQFNGKAVIASVDGRGPVIGRFKIDHGYVYLTHPNDVPTVVQASRVRILAIVRAAIRREASRP